MQIFRTYHKTLIGVCAAWLMTAGPVSAQGTWVEELANVVAYYQLMSPAVEWTPYIDVLTRARHGLRQGDQVEVAAAMQEFEGLLRSNAHGMDQTVAEDLYSLALLLRSPYEPVLLPLSKERERVRSTVPLLKINVQSQSRIWCHEGGCDEWVSEPGAG